MLHLADITLGLLSMLIFLSLFCIAYAIILLKKQTNQPRAIGHLLYSVTYYAGFHLIVYLWCHLICSKMPSISSYLVIGPSDLINAYATFRSEHLTGCTLHLLVHHISNCPLLKVIHTDQLVPGFSLVHPL